MPRRGTDVVQFVEPPKKRNKVIIDVPSSLDVSFFDDEALPPGIVFSDIKKKKWRIGKPIGRGSFGRIYLASDEVDKEVTKQNAKYVVKIEPHSNGPLFVEIHCLIRSGKATNVKQWRIQNHQKHLGMPVYIASGSFVDENTDTKYRFLVLPRYDIDLQKVIARTRVLDLKNVLILSIQILDVLEYLHQQGYTHSDIKSSNLMLGLDGQKFNKLQVIKRAPSYEKETKELGVLAGKQRRIKSAKGRASNYYEDEDFIMKDCKKNEEERLANVKNKLRKILSDKDSRTLHRHHAFNLRQLTNYVNYEDISSSVCSDQSYQKLLDDFGNKACLNNVDMMKTETDETLSEAVLSQSNGQIYLLDYGLASRFLDADGNHKAFDMDARKAHDGTLEYSSRDSHIGAHSRRSDLETLGFNLLDWLTGTLPWKTAEVLAEPDLVHALKKKFMADIISLLKTCFKTEFYPQFIEKYFEYVTSLEYTQKPDYDYCRSLFRSELLKNGFSTDMRLNFTDALMSSINRKLGISKLGKKTPGYLNGIKKAHERENVYSLENYLKLELLKQTLNSSSDGFRKPCTSRNFFISDADLVARLKKSLMPQEILGKKLSPKNLRSHKKIIKRRGKRTHKSSIGKFGNFMGSARQFTWAEILAGNPEDIIRKERNNTNNDKVDDDENCKYRIRRLSSSSSDMSDTHSPLMQKDYLQGRNPTSVMKEIHTKFRKKMQGKEIDEEFPYIEGYNKEMIKILKMIEKRKAKEELEASKAQNEITQVKKRYMRMRSTKEKSTKTDTKSESKRVVQKKAKSPVKVLEEESVKVRSSTRSKSNKNNKKSEEKEVAILLTPMKPKKALDPKKKTPAKKAPSVPVNKMKLRSGKRNK